MSIRLSPDEAWQVLAATHTGILTTLRRNGAPISLPVWFVVEDRTIAMRTPSPTKKVARIRHDSRAAFLVEAGEQWAELSGVHLSGHVAVVDDPDAVARINAALDAKYAAFRPPAASLPEKTQARYAHQTFLRFVPEGRLLTWDNSRLFP